MVGQDGVHESKLVACCWLLPSDDMNPQPEFLATMLGNDVIRMGCAWLVLTGV